MDAALTFRETPLYRLQQSFGHPEGLNLQVRLVLKRGLDILGAGMGILLAAPLMGLVALAVKFSSQGPVLYKQARLGKGGAEFTIYKFRTMRVDAESNGPQWAQTDDPRVTRIGGFLRRTHLDELPQLFNVLEGSMSLVGPRPERPAFAEELNKQVPSYDQRLLVKPGLTGLAQIHYRYDCTVEDVKKKLRYDLLYVRRMCLLLDLQIIWKTATLILGVFLGKGRTLAEVRIK
ncbi:MAG: sugar transferase [Candidatus Omnitrophica bacterium]|nr:sugar transferase [Candidatus Omnitrophota bacterium]